MPVTPNNIGWNQVNKAVTKGSTEAIKLARDLTLPTKPTSALDAVGQAAGYAVGRPIKNARIVGGIVGKGARAVAKLYRNSR